MTMALRPPFELIWEPSVYPLIGERMERAYELQSLFVEKGDEIPKDVPRFRLQKKTPLTNCKLCHTFK